MTAQSNKDVVRRYVEEFKSGGKEAGAKELRSPVFLHPSPPPGAPAGPGGGLIAFRPLRAAFPDMAVTVEDMVSEGDKVVPRQTFSGTHQGTWLGVRATGRKVAWSVIDIVRLEDGLLVEHWAVADFY